MAIGDNPPVGSGIGEVFNPTIAPAGPRKQPKGANPGVTFDEQRAFEMTFDINRANLIDSFGGGGGGGAGDAAQRRNIATQEKFGLANIALDREQQVINERDAREGAINNALRRGIFRSGIRKQNVERVGEQGELQVRRLNLNEAELKERIANSLAALKAGAADRRSAAAQREKNALANFAQQQAIAQMEFDLRGGGAYIPAFQGPLSSLTGDGRTGR